MPALIIASLWMSVGFNMIYFWAACKASIESVWKRRISMAPMAEISLCDPARDCPGDALCHALSLIGSFQLFELPFILLNGPGPENRGLTVVMYLYQYGFEVGDLGYASGIGWTLALVLMGLTIIQRMLSREQ